MSNLYEFRKRNESIKVAFAPDDNCINYALVAMVSLLENTKRTVDIIILYSSLSEQSLKHLEILKKYKNCNLILKPVDTAIFEGFHTASWTPVQAWFRSKIPDLFLEFDKVIYLDCDTMTRADVSQLYDINISDYLAGAVKDLYYSEIMSEKLELKSGVYFNSGVVLINCKKWREEDLFKKIEDCAKNNPKVKYGDQDVLNVVIDESKKVLSPKFNIIENYAKNYAHEYEGAYGADYDNRKDCAVVVHFACHKPTYPETQNTFKEEWWEYAKKTPFYVELLEKFRQDAQNLIYSKLR